jgi:hypothetical protein
MHHQSSLCSTFGGGAATVITVYNRNSVVIFLVGFTLSLAIITWGFTHHSNDQYFGQILGFISMTVEVVHIILRPH